MIIRSSNAAWVSRIQVACVRRVHLCLHGRDNTEIPIISIVFRQARLAPAQAPTSATTLSGHYQSKKNHLSKKALDGVDIRTPDGTEVVAVDDGIVKYASDELKSYGQMILIVHLNGSVTTDRGSWKLVTVRTGVTDQLIAWRRTQHPECLAAE